MKDKFNVTLKPGDFIAYAVREGNSGEMKIGKVFDTEDNQARVRGLRTWGAYSVGNIGTLFYSERIVKLHPDTVPEEIKELYFNS